MDYLVLFTMGFIAALTPGPDIFYIIRQGLCKGVKSAFLAVIGILIGNIIYLSLVYFIGGFLSKNIYFIFTVSFLGGLYLFRIAYLIYHDTPTLKKDCDTFNGFKIIKEALFLNISNPKAMIFFTVVITPFLSKNIFLSIISLFLGISLAFIISAYLSSIINLNQKILIIINKIAATIFLLFSIILFFESYKALIKIL